MIYVGLANGKREVFKSDNAPTYATHGAKYQAVIGEFKTMRGAKFMRDYGANNPHIQTVNDAEKLAKLYKN